MFSPFLLLFLHLFVCGCDSEGFEDGRVTLLCACEVLSEARIALRNQGLSAATGNTAPAALPPQSVALCNLPAESCGASLPAGLAREHPLVPGGARLVWASGLKCLCALGDSGIFLCTKCLREQEKLVAMFLALTFSGITRKSLLVELQVCCRPGSWGCSPQLVMGRNGVKLLDVLLLTQRWAVQAARSWSCKGRRMLWCGSGPAVRGQEHLLSWEQPWELGENQPNSSEPHSCEDFACWCVVGYVAAGQRWW